MENRRTGIRKSDANLRQRRFPHGLRLSSTVDPHDRQNDHFQRRRSAAGGFFSHFVSRTNATSGSVVSRRRSHRSDFSPSSQFADTPSATHDRMEKFSQRVFATGSRRNRNAESEESDEGKRDDEQGVDQRKPIDLVGAGYRSQTFNTD